MTDTIESLAEEIEAAVTAYCRDKIRSVQLTKTIFDTLTRARALGPEWLPLSDEAKSGKTIWVSYPWSCGRIETQAYWLPANTARYEDDWGDESDEFIPEGWYERSREGETHYRLSAEPDFWMPLLPPPAQEPGQ